MNTPKTTGNQAGEEFCLLSMPERSALSFGNVLDSFASHVWPDGDQRTSRLAKNSVYPINLYITTLVISRKFYDQLVCPEIAKLARQRNREIAS